MDQQRWRRPFWLALTAALMLVFSGVAAANESERPLNLIGTNPAMIGKEGFLRLFVGGSLDLGNNALHSVDLVKLLEHHALDQAVFDLLPSDGLRLWLDNVNGIELGIGPVEFRTQVHLSSAARVKPELLRLVFDTPEVGNTYYADGSEVTVGGYATLSAGGSLGLPAVAGRLGWDDFRIGARIHALSGVAYARAVVSGNVAFEPDKVNGVLVGELWDRPSETSPWTAGQGYAFDIGVQGRLSERWHVGVGVANLAGRLTWNDVHYRRFESNVTWDAVSQDYELDWDLVAEETQTIVWYLPRRIEGTVGFRASDTLLISAGIEQTTYFDQEGRPSDARTDLHANVVWEGISFMPLSAGVTYSGVSGWTLATGAALHLGPVHLTAQINSVPLPNFGREVGISFGASLTF